MQRVTHLSCKRDQIKMRDYVDRRVTHQSGLSHLPGVPHLHVNRSLDFSFFVLNISADKIFFFLEIQRGQVTGFSYTVFAVNFFNKNEV